jgi:hypothetical protein
MFRILATVGLAAALWACTPTQDIEITDAASGGDGRAVAVDPQGLTPQQTQRVGGFLTAMGYRVDPDASARARVDFSIGAGVEKEIRIEYPEYEEYQEIREVNGQQVVFTEERLAGYRIEEFVDTIYPATAILEIVSADGAASTVRRVETEGLCGEERRLKPLMIDALVSGREATPQRIELPDC